MNVLRKLITRYPYRGLFGWATICVWGFLASEILWHLSRLVRRYDLLEIPLAVPYAPIAFLIDPHDALMNHESIFFIALANWFAIFVVGAIVSLRRASAAVVGTAMLCLLLACSLGRAAEYWIIHPPGPMP